MENSIEDKVIKRIMWLASMADPKSGASENEMQVAAMKMAALLEKHNLEMHQIMGASGAAKRSDQKRSGGLYTWQRKLWKSVAEMNFCVYFTHKGLDRGAKYEHRIVGSKGNVIATEVMAQYLQETIEKLGQTWAKGEGYGSVFVKEAIAYRQGMTDRLAEKLDDRRYKIVEDAKRAAREEAARKAATAEAGATTHALTILDVISEEEDLNNDYLNGWEIGTTARNRKESEARQAAWRKQWQEEAAAQAAHDLAHPEEAAARKKREAEELERYLRKERARANRRREPVYRERAQTKDEQRANMPAYRTGYHDGDRVSIDTQVDRSKQERIG